MSSMSAEAATTVAAASGSNVSECLKDISDISNYPDLQNGEDTSSQKQQKKKRAGRRRRRGRRKKLLEEQGSCGSESVAAALDKSSSCNNENENDVLSYAHLPRDVKPTMAENGGATTHQKQQRKGHNRSNRDKIKSGEQGGNGESSTVAATDKDRKVVPAIKNMSSVSGASDSNRPITIRISNPDFGKDLTLRVKKTTKMKKYFASYVTSKSIPSHASLRFTIDGKDIQPDDTPKLLGLKENDVIKCSDLHAPTTDTLDANVLEKRDDVEAVANILLKNNDACSIVFEDECLMSNILHFEGSWLSGNASDTIGLVCKGWNSFAIGKKGGKALAIILDEQDKKLIDVAKEVMKDEIMSWSARILAMAIADDREGLSNAFRDEYDSSQGVGAAFEEAIMYDGPVRSLEVVCPSDHPFYQCCSNIQQFHRDVMEFWYGDDDPDDVDGWATLFACNTAFAAAKVGSTSAVYFIQDKVDMLWEKEFDEHGSTFIRRLVTYACRFPTLQGPVASVGEIFHDSWYVDTDRLNCMLHGLRDGYLCWGNDLHLAASRGHKDLVKALLKVGMNPKRICSYRKGKGTPQNLRTPADWADARGHSEVALLLRRASR